MSNKLLSEHQQNLAEIRIKTLNMIRVLGEEKKEVTVKNEIKIDVNGFIKLCTMLIRLIPVEYQINLNLMNEKQQKTHNNVSQDDIEIITDFLQEICTKKRGTNE